MPVPACGRLATGMPRLDEGNRIQKAAYLLHEPSNEPEVADEADVLQLRLLCHQVETPVHLWAGSPPSRPPKPHPPLPHDRVGPRAVGKTEL